ncbi:class I SAM-dependent methyltransferase [Olivibacter ginsenosidimutans]
MRIQNNYDAIAEVYDFLSRLVFGKAQVKVQIDLISHIAPKSTILIVGGGSGWILEELAKRYADGLTITYLELSQRMLNLSKKRKYGKNSVYFKHGAIEDDTEPSQFDVIITPFLFDNFAEARTTLVFDKLTAKLRTSGLWLFADFVVDNRDAYWKRIMLKLMYRFFGWLCTVEAKHLIDVRSYFGREKYTLLTTYRYYAGFIQGKVYVKATTAIPLSNCLPVGGV